MTNSIPFLALTELIFQRKRMDSYYIFKETILQH